MSHRDTFADTYVWRRIKGRGAGGSCPPTSPPSATSTCDHKLPVDLAAYLESVRAFHGVPTTRPLRVIGAGGYSWPTARGLVWSPLSPSLASPAAHCDHPPKHHSHDIAIADHDANGPTLNNPSPRRAFWDAKRGLVVATPWCASGGSTCPRWAARTHRGSGKDLTHGRSRVGFSNGGGSCG
jgi:hypothetical protein